MRIVDGWLEKAHAGDPLVLRYPTVRTRAMRDKKPLGIVWHYTGGFGGPKYVERLVTRIQKFDRKVDRPASWHVLIAKDGTLWQSASCEVGTWHCRTAGMIAGHRTTSINSCTVGIELENAGRLKKVFGGFSCWPFKDTPIIPDGRVIKTDKGYFEDFTDAQVASAASLVGLLMQEYSIPHSAAAYSHAQFDPQRREDPGPLWMHKYLPHILDMSGSPLHSPNATNAAG